MAEQNPYAPPDEAGARQVSTVQRREIPGCFWVFGILAALLLVGAMLGWFME